MKHLKRIAIGLAGSMILITPALAHPGHGVEALGYAHGFLHPLMGLDHVLAMTAVGLYAARLGGRALLCLPLASIAALLLGSVVGHVGIGLPMVEQAIVLSVVAAGAAIALGLNLPLKSATVLVAAFALFHGHAHGSEAAATTTFLSYAAGFSTATFLLLITGIAIGDGLKGATGRLAQLVRRAP